MIFISGQLYCQREVEFNILNVALKYHILRFNPDYEGRLITLLRNDIADILHIIFVNLCSLEAYLCAENLNY
jgi:hypothetical protein